MEDLCDAVRATPSGLPLDRDWEDDSDSALLGNDFVFCTAFITGKAEHCHQLGI